MQYATRPNTKYNDKLKFPNFTIFSTAIDIGIENKRRIIFKV